MTPERDALDTFLAATDLDFAAAAAEAVDAGDETTAVRAGAVVDAGTDRQAMANLLLHPDLIPAVRRIDAIERALRGRDGYLTLAAAAGAGQLDRGGLARSERARLVAALLDVTASEMGLTSRRAAAALGSLVDALDAPELLVMLHHPDPGVRRNILSALRPMLGTTSLAEILVDRDEISQSDADEVTAQLIADGVDLDRPAATWALLPVLDYLPNLVDFE